MGIERTDDETAAVEPHQNGKFFSSFQFTRGVDSYREVTGRTGNTPVLGTEYRLGELELFYAGQILLTSLVRRQLPDLGQIGLPGQVKDYFDLRIKCHVSLYSLGYNNLNVPVALASKAPSSLRNSPSENSSERPAHCARPSASTMPVAAAIKLTFISTVRAPLHSSSSERPALASATSSKVINTPPCMEPQLFSSSGRGSSRSLTTPESLCVMRTPRCSTNGT